MRHRWKSLATGTLAVAVCLFLGYTLYALLPLSDGRRREVAAASPSASNLVGREYAESLGLHETLWPVVGGCDLYVGLDQETAEETGYCLDELIGFSDQEKRAAALQIQGAIPSEIDLAIIDLQLELETLANTQENAEERDRILDELHDLALQKQAEEQGG